MAEMPFHLYRLQASRMAVHVLTYLWHYAGRDHFVWPSRKTIARDLQLNQRTLRRYLLELRKAGVIEPGREERRGRGYEGWWLRERPGVCCEGERDRPLLPSESEDAGDDLAESQDGDAREETGQTQPVQGEVADHPRPANGGETGHSRPVAVERTGHRRPVEAETGHTRPVAVDRTGHRRPVEAETGHTRPVAVERTGHTRPAEAETGHSRPVPTERTGHTRPLKGVARSLTTARPD
ncbi:MAG: helix-turn-helix domain-containing protein, partial [Deltaproteobacteria bacterium]|nr:helix-turn-helix domain-containing protein [Deltaproteobacteria bacterium]